MYPDVYSEYLLKHRVGESLSCDQQPDHQCELYFAHLSGMKKDEIKILVYLEKYKDGILTL